MRRICGAAIIVLALTALAQAQQQMMMVQSPYASPRMVVVQLVIHQVLGGAEGVNSVPAMLRCCRCRDVLRGTVVAPAGGRWLLQIPVESDFRCRTGCVQRMSLTFIC